MRQGFQEYSDMRQGCFLNTTCDMAINKRQTHATSAFFKSAGDMGTPVKGPTAQPLLSVRPHIKGNNNERWYMFYIKMPRHLPSCVEV